MAVNFDKEPAIIQATAKGDLSTVQKLIEESVDNILIKASNQWDAFAFAAFFGHVDILRFLAAQDKQDIHAPIAMECGLSLTPLQMLAHQGHIDATKVLIDCGALVMDNLTCNQNESDSSKESSERMEDESPELWGFCKNETVRKIFEYSAKLFDICTYYKDGMDIKEEIERCLKEGASLNQKDSSGNTPLHCAAKSGSETTVATLIKLGADITAENDKEQWPIHYAAMLGHLGILTLFVSQKIDLQKEDVKGFTPFLYACKSGSLPSVEYLLEEGADPNDHTSNGNNGLLIAVKAGAFEVVKCLIETHKFIPFAMKMGNGWAGINVLGDDALIIAARHGDVEIIRYLVKLGASINGRNVTGMNALLVAAASGNLDAVQCLLSLSNKELLYKSRDKNRMNPLMHSVYSSSSSTVKFFIAQGINLSLTNIEGDTAITMALEEGSDKIQRVFRAVETLEMLVKHSNPSAEDVQNIPALLKAGANLKQRSGEHGRTPLMLAIEYGNIAVVRALLEQGAELSDMDIDNPTLEVLERSPAKNGLDLASELASRSCVRLENGASEDMLQNQFAWHNRRLQILAICQVHNAKLIFKDLNSTKIAINSLFPRVFDLPKDNFEDGLFWLAVELRDQLQCPKRAYEIFLLISKEHKKFEQAQEALMEIRYADHAPKEPCGLDQDPAKENLSMALEHGLQAGYSQQAYLLRQYIVGDMLSMNMVDPLPIEGDLATPKGVVQLLEKYIDTKQVVELQATQLKALQEKLEESKDEKESAESQAVQWEAMSNENYDLKKKFVELRQQLFQTQITNNLLNQKQIILNNLLAGAHMQNIQLQNSLLSLIQPRIQPASLIPLIAPIPFNAVHMNTPSMPVNTGTESTTTPIVRFTLGKRNSSALDSSSPSNNSSTNHPSNTQTGSNKKPRLNRQ